MPITITIPPSGGTTGVGFDVAGSTTILPTNLTDYFFVRVTPTTDENITIQYGCQQAAGQNTFVIELGITQDCTANPTIGRPGLAQGATARLVAELRTETHAVRESVSIPVIWDGAGMLWRYGDDRGWGLSAPAGGFTQADRDLLGHVDSAVWKPWPRD